MAQSATHSGLAERPCPMTDSNRTVNDKMTPNNSIAERRLKRERKGAAGKAAIVYLASGSLGAAVVAYLIFHSMGC